MSSEESSSSSSQQSDSDEREEDNSLGGSAGTEGSEDRRARTAAQWPVDKVIVTAITADGMPIPKKERQRMRRLAGLIARQKVSLILPRFSSLGKQGKKVLFDDYVMPFLEFSKEMEDKGFKRAMKAISKCWRNYKSTLVTYMMKNRSPFERFKHLKQEDYDAFVKLKSSEEFKETSDRFKILRGQNKHPHHLGTGGYDGKIEVWAAEDEKLENDGLPNPWLQYPGRARTWLRARGRLTPSGEINFSNQETMEVSDKIKELSEDSLSVTGKEDALTKALGNPEHPGRVRGVSSYQGWKIALPGYKRKRVSEEYMEKLAESIRSQVLQDVIASIPSILSTQGLKIVPVSPSPDQTSPADARRSSCSSIDAPESTLRAEHDLYADLMQHEPLIPEMDPDSISLLTEPTSCTLLANIGGYQIQVAMGQVHPKQTEVHNVQVADGFVVVFVDSVDAKFRNEKLERPVNDEATTVGEALLQWVQWRRALVVINNKPMEKVRPPKIPPKPPLGSKKPDKSANIIDQDSQYDKNGEGRNAKKAKGSEQGSQHDTYQEGRKPKKGTKSSQDLRMNVSSTHDKAVAKKAISTDTGKKVIKVASIASASAAKCSKKADIQTPKPSLWTQPNSKFKYGTALMSAAELEKAGPHCTTLHSYYLKGCKDKKHQIAVFFRASYLLRREGAPFVVDYADLYDLFHIDALDMSIVRLFTLYLSKESKNNSWPVTVLDPMMMSLSVIEGDKDDEVVSYVARAMCHNSNSTKEFLMFPCNIGGHWIAVIISMKWGTVWYLDSVFGKEYNIEILTELLDSAWALYIATEGKKKKEHGALKHLTKFPCHQQPGNNACGFYTCHHMLAIAGSRILKKPEDIVFSTCPLDDWAVAGLRENLAKFLVSEVISPKGEFHHPTAIY